MGHRRAPPVLMLVSLCASPKSCHQWVGPDTFRLWGTPAEWVRCPSRCIQPITYRFCGHPDAFRIIYEKDNNITLTLLISSCSGFPACSLKVWVSSIPTSLAPYFPFCSYEHSTMRCHSGVSWCLLWHLQVYISQPNDLGGGDEGFHGFGDMDVHSLRLIWLKWLLGALCP